MAAEVEHSQTGSNDGRGSMVYPLHATVGDKVNWLRIAFSPGSSRSMVAEALHGLRQESYHRDMLSRITRIYGRESFVRDVSAFAKQLYSHVMFSWLLYCGNVLEPGDFDAISINERLKENSLRRATQLICSSTALEIEQIKERYQAIFGVQLEVDIGRFTDGNHKELLLKFISIPPGRHGDDDIEMVDREQLARTLISLREEITKIPESPQKIIMNNVVGKSKEYIGALFHAYAANHGISLGMDLRTAHDGLFEDGLLTIMKCSVDRPKYFAKLLHTARTQNDRETILWVIATMAKRPDMERIKAEYSDRYGRTLEGDVSDEFSDRQDYLELIRPLLNYNVPNRGMQV